VRWRDGSRWCLRFDRSGLRDDWRRNDRLLERVGPCAIDSGRLVLSRFVDRRKVDFLCSNVVHLDD
jgi:hypothetical protein